MLEFSPSLSEKGSSSKETFKGHACVMKGKMGWGGGFIVAKSSSSSLTLEADCWLRLRLFK